MPKSITSSIFLAGPTHRPQGVRMPRSWRADALEILQMRGFEGTVFVPEERSGKRNKYDEGNYPAWEHEALSRSDVILFWVPRDLKTLPAFTTNVEFGLFAHSEKSIFGAPDSAPKNSYLKFCAQEFGISSFNTLDAAIDAAVIRCTPGAVRTGGECQIPLILWNTPSFKSWLSTQKQAGNRLDGAVVEWIKTFPSNRQLIYAWAIHANVFVREENRNKSNESVISRPDISSVVLYENADALEDVKIVLVKEFRSSANTEDGFIWSVPSGSSHDFDKDPTETAVEEVEEETGLQLDKGRLKYLSTRQLMGTFSTHKSSVFAAELSADEMRWLESQQGITHGVDANSEFSTGEKTYVEVKTIAEIISDDLCDWSTLGMLFQALAP